MKNNKPILLVIDHFGSGGAQRQIVNIANGLIEKGENVHIFIYYPEFTHYRDLLNEKVVVFHSHKKNKLGLNVIFYLAKLLLKFKYSHALAFLKTPAFYLEVAKLTTMSSVKIVYSERTSIELMTYGFIDELKIKLHGLCSFITSNSIVQSVYLQKIYPNTEVIYIPNAMPQYLFDIPIVLSNKKQLSVFAHTTVYKNYDYLIDAIIAYKELFDCDPPVVNWFGRIFDEALLQSSLKRLNDKSLAHCIVFHGQILDVGPVLMETKFLIHPSKFESSSNAVLEALSSGTPVLVGDISDHQHIIDESEAGYIFELSNPTSLAYLLRKVVVMSEEDYGFLTKNSRSYSSNNYKLEMVVDSYHKLLSQ